MGVGNSTLNSQVIDKVEFKLDGQTDDMEKMMTQLKFLIEVHTSRKNTFDKVKTNTTQYEIEKDFLEQLLKSYEDSKDQENILYLYNIGALYNEKVGATSKVLKFHPKFENVYSTFLDNLNSLILINKSELSSNANVINSSDLSNMRDKTKLKLNNILARVLFYAYAIAYNNYLMYIYSMYAEKQFKAMDSNYRKMKKRSEFKDIGDELDKKLKEIQTTLISNKKTTLNEIETSIQDLQKTFEDRKGNASKSFVGGNTKKGGSTANGQFGNLKALIDLHDKKMKEYERSNKVLAQFFDMINKIVKEKSVEKLEEYKTLRITNIMNKNLKATLEDIENKIKSHKIHDFNDIDSMNESEFQEMLSKYYQLDEEDKQYLTKFKGIIGNFVKLTHVKQNQQTLANAIQQETLEVTNSPTPTFKPSIPVVQPQTPPPQNASRTQNTSRTQNASKTRPQNASRPQQQTRPQQNASRPQQQTRLQNASRTTQNSSSQTNTKPQTRPQQNTNSKKTI
jgi:hypothetical protein